MGVDKKQPKPERSSTFPVFNLGKSLFLLLNGNTPVSTAMKDGAICCLFNYADANPYARVYQSVMDSVIEEARSGVAMPPGEMENLAELCWSRMEAKAAKKQAAGQ